MPKKDRFKTTRWAFKLGTRVKDQVTDFEGTITSRIEYLNGCLQYCVEPKVGKDGKKEKYEYIDEGQLIFIEGPPEKPSKEEQEGPGGRMPNEPD